VVGLFRYCHFPIGLNSYDFATFTVANVPPGLYAFNATGSIKGDWALGSFTVTRIPVVTTIIVPVNYSLCVMRLGVEQTGWTVLWLPGYGYPDIPVSQCQNMTDVLGQDVLGRTIVLHQFIQNRTYYEKVTVPVS
jgi:hypothetical protein